MSGVSFIKTGKSFILDNQQKIIKINSMKIDENLKNSYTFDSDKQQTANIYSGFYEKKYLYPFNDIAFLFDTCIHLSF